MNIVLISFDSELYCLGLRTLSSVLRQKGHKVKCVFLPLIKSGKSGFHKFQATYSGPLLEALLSLCSDSDLIGMSLMTNQFNQAKTVTEYLKDRSMKAPVIWGGIEPTVEPDECLKFADIVCVGEGEDALSELCDRLKDGKAYLNIQNLWINSSESVVRNPLRPLRQDLDSLPFPDYSCDGHFICKNDSIVELTVREFLNFRGERFKGNGKSINYPIMTSRGCPFSCTYCCNGVLRRLYPGEKLLRWRSVDNVVKELDMIRTKLAPIDLVIMVDDNFTAMIPDQLRKFCEVYKHDIGLPFFSQISPLTINKEKMDILLDAGCVKVTMGVETGSKRIATMYGREKIHGAVPSAISLVENYRAAMKFPPTYQFITDNPYETAEETLETLCLALSLPRPWDNPVYSLMFFPGTALYRKAVEDGFIKDKYAQVYGKNWLDQSKPFFQFWIRLYRANFPRFILRFLLSGWVVRGSTNRFADRIWRTPCFSWLWSKTD